MTQIQNHGSSSRLYVTSANALTKDKAVTRVGVQIDTALWSKRKRNIIVNSLRTGVATCGADTAELVYELARSVDTYVNMVTSWNRNINSDEVKPDKLDELLAYTSAWLRMRGVPQDGPGRWYRYVEDLALKAIDDGRVPNTIPLNQTMTYDEQREFIHEYLKASDERENAQLQRLIGEIERGETITIEITK